MKWTKLLSLLSAVGLGCVSCSSSPPVGPEFTSVEYPADNRKAHIYIYAEGTRWASKDSFILALDGDPLVTISTDSYVLIDINPGEVEFSADQITHLHYLDYMSSGNTTSDILTTYEVLDEARVNAQVKYIPLLKREFEGGKTYFYKLNKEWTFPAQNPKPVLEEVDEAQALDELEGLGLAGPP